MSIVQKYQFVRLKEELKEENLLIIASAISRLTIDSKSLNVLTIASTYSKSEEYDLNNVPEDIQRVEPLKKEITEEECKHLIELFNNDSKAFIYYS